MQDRVPEARIYKVWLAPEWTSDESDLSAARRLRPDERQDLAALSAARLRGPDRDRRQRVPHDQRDRRRLRRLCDRRRRRRTCAAVEQALDEELARFLAEGPTRAELERVRTEIRCAVHSRRRAGRRLRRQVATSWPRTPSTAAGPTSTGIRSSSCATATQQQVLAAARKWITASRSSSRSTVSDGARQPSGADRRSLEAADAADVPRRAVPDARARDADERHAADRRGTPRRARRAIQPAARRRLRGRPVRLARRRDDDDGDARRGHGVAWTRSRSAMRCAALGAELDVRRQSRLLRRRPVRAQGEPRRFARDLRRRDPEPGVRAGTSSSD